MKMTTVLVLTMMVLSLAAFGTRSAEAAETAKKGGAGKILVAYFSWSGNTREIATQIHERVGGDLFEIKTSKAYPADYHECTEVAKKEQAAKARPALSTKVADMASYDVVFVGYPIWWGTPPMAVFTFLEQYDLSGKTVIPFCTHGGSGLGRSAQEIAETCPKAKVLQALAVGGSGAKGAQNEVASWLRTIGMTM